MKSPRALIALSFAICLSSYGAIGSALREANLPEIVTTTVPSLSFSKGDKGWSGGMFTNGYVASTSFDSNTSYAIYQSTEDIDASKAAPAILHAIAEKFKLPISDPSSSWTKRTPLGLKPEDYAETFLSSFPKKDRTKAAEYVTVEIVKSEAHSYAVQITYINVKNE
jgi:hypothetical protein